MVQQALDNFECLSLRNAVHLHDIHCGSSTAELTPCLTQRCGLHHSHLRQRRNQWRDHRTGSCQHASFNPATHSMKVPNAWVNLLKQDVSICAIYAGLLAISRAIVPIALPKVSTPSASSASAAAKSTASLSRRPATAFKSASFAAMAPFRSSTFWVRQPQP